LMPNACLCLVLLAPPISSTFFHPLSTSSTLHLHRLTLFPFFVLALSGSPLRTLFSAPAPATTSTRSNGWRPSACSTSASSRRS
jgi:hypothetical protein